MSELHRYYARRLIWLFGALLVGTLALDQLHTTLTKRHSASWLLDLTNLQSHRAVLGAVLLLGEIFIRKVLWRLEHPDLDFGGRWRGTTTYEKRWLDGEDTTPPPAEHEVDIKQDCLGVAIQPTAAEAFAQWRSLICDLPADGSIAYTYEVVYQGASGLPPSAKGYEVLQVVGRDKRRRPCRISGQFHHLVSNDTPVFSGVAHFQQVPKRARLPRLRRARVQSDGPNKS